MTATRLRTRRTKIVATLGPASSEPGVVRDLVRSGVSVFRLNMSHGSHDAHAEVYGTVRAAAAELDAPVAVLADLCGPKIRVGVFPDGPIDLRHGDEVVVTARAVPGGPGLIPSQYDAIHRDVQPGAQILLADGLLALRVDSVDGTEVRCTVLRGGPLGDRKGINLPDVEVSAPALTAKDREDAAFAQQLGVDYVALSFVRDASDVQQLRGLLGDTTPIIAKIERARAVDEIDAIIEASDGIMVARGDLGVELPPEVVPILQRQLVARARAAHRPVIVATQMLESMIHHAQPTRAEVSDVSTAVFAGADAVMLSGETATGAHPVLAVDVMDRIAREVEAHLWAERAFVLDDGAGTEDVALSVGLARATAQLSRDLRVRAIVVFTAGGGTAATMSSARPAAPLIGVTSDPATQRRLNLLWGVVPVVVAGPDLDDPGGVVRRLAVDLGLARPGQRVLTVAGLGDRAQRDPTISVLTV